MKNRPIAHRLACATAGVAAGLIAGTAALAQSGMNSTRLQHEVVLDGLDSPWDMAFLEDGTMFFTEKCDGLSVRLPSGEVNALLGMSESEGYAATAEDLVCEGQAGMMGVAVDPDFAQTRRIYVYSTSRMSDPWTNRLMRLEVDDDFTTVSDRTDIVDDVPYKVAPSDHPFGGPGAHNGGRVRFGPDGALWLTTGDNHNPEIPQSPTMMGSKVLRLDTDGNAHPDNSPPDGFDPRTYTYGHRNVQGIAFHPATGTAITAEHGPVAFRRDHRAAQRRQWRLGSARQHGRARRLPGRVLRLHAQPDGGHEPVCARGLHADDRFRHLSRCHAAHVDQQRLVAGHLRGRVSRGRAMGRLGRGMVVGLMGIGFGGTPLGQRIDVLELSAEDGDIAVVDATEMTLPMPSGRFRALVLGPDGSLYTALEEGSIHKLTPGS